MYGKQTSCGRRVQEGGAPCIAFLDSPRFVAERNAICEEERYLRRTVAREREAFGCLKYYTANVAKGHPDVSRGDVCVFAEVHAHPAMLPQGTTYTPPLGPA